MIRWITDCLGTGPYDQVGTGDWRLLDVRHLVDKAGNSDAAVAKVVRDGVEALQRGQKVVIACDFGISRSNAIAAGILSLAENRPYDQAVAEVIRTTGEREIKLDLIESVRSALGAARSSADRKTVLVTGACGFLGRPLLERLRQSGVALGPPRSELDLERGAAVLSNYCNGERVGQIIHLAYPRHYTNATAMASSLLMLRTVLDVCRISRIRLVFVSDWVVYSGQTETSIAADEATAMRPKGVYGETKYLEEMLVDLYHRRNEIDRSICRLTAVYGPGGDRPRFIRTFRAAVLRGETVATHKYRNGRPALDLLYVDDAVDALVRVVGCDHPDVFHFGTGKLHTTADLLQIIGRLSDRPVHHEEIPVDEDLCNVSMVSTKAHNLLGWSPQVSIEKGLALTV